MPPTGVVCSTQSKVWMDEIRMLEWIEKIWAPYVGNGSNPALLSLDTFSGHLTKKSQAIVIPGGCTSVLQPLDVSINKPIQIFHPAQMV